MEQILNQKIESGSTQMDFIVFPAQAEFTQSTEIQQIAWDLMARDGLHFSWAGVAKLIDCIIKTVSHKQKPSSNMT